MNGFYKFAIRVLRVVMPLWYKLETEGLENVPEGSGYLFVSNHRSNADPILIGVQNPETQFCFLAKQELFPTVWSAGCSASSVRSRLTAVPEM